MITRKDVVTGSGSYPEREKSPELTPEVLKNIDELLVRVNKLLADPALAAAIKKLGKLKVSSGFRPSAINANIANAAKKSNHMTGESLDLLDDKDQSLAKAITKGLLIKYDLYMESPTHTIGKLSNWTHLQTKKTLSGNRIFFP